MRHGSLVPGAPPNDKAKGSIVVAGRRALRLAAAVCGSGACSYGLHPHRTLDGRAFKWDAVDTIRQGMGEADVTVILEPPLEVLADGPDAATSRYYERAQLRGCRQEVFGFIPWSDTPKQTVEAKIYFRRGRVEKVEVVRSN